MTLKVVELNANSRCEFDLFYYRHLWLTPYLLAVQQVKGWVLYEVLKYEPNLLIVREIRKLKDLEEVEQCLREYAV
ncbi:hypothetical protein Hydth_0519 [Hydrogenobacter thermophilus TK-6]|nr:hypothetical protein [Hydrogenobacter thermophilus]ADO44919.1 hypothetical protein Hydth_0519 [Hydrogenobacter thermophilus TK-6]